MARPVEPLAMDKTMKSKLSLKVTISVHKTLAALTGVLWTLHEMGLL